MYTQVNTSYKHNVIKAQFNRVGEDKSFKYNLLILLKLRHAQTKFPFPILLELQIIFHLQKKSSPIKLQNQKVVALSHLKQRPHQACLHRMSLCVLSEARNASTRLLYTPASRNNSRKRSTASPQHIFGSNEKARYNFLVHSNRQVLRHVFVLQLWDYR